MYRDSAWDGTRQERGGTVTPCLRSCVDRSEGGTDAPPPKKKRVHDREAQRRAHESRVDTNGITQGCTLRTAPKVLQRQEATSCQALVGSYLQALLHRLGYGCLLHLLQTTRRRCEYAAHHLMAGS